MYGILLLGRSSIENFFQFVVVVILFIFVLAITYFTTRWIGGYQAGQQMERNIKVIETVKVTNNKFLQIIKIGEKYYLISIGKDEIHLLTELSDEKLKEPELKELPGFSAAKGSFQKILEETKKRLKK